MQDPGDPVLVVLDPEDLLFLVRGKYLHRVPADTQRSTVEVHVVALVLQVDQPSQERVAGELRAFLDADRHRRVILRGPEPVDARDGGDTITSPRVITDLVALCRILSICSLIAESFSM